MPVERAFPLTVTNGTGTEKTFQLTFAPNIASFDQFDDTLDVLNVSLFPYSSATGTVYLKSTNPKASVTVSVTEVTCGPTSCTPVTGGLSGKVTLNLDPTTPTEAGDPNNFTDTHTPLVSNPLVSNLNPPAPLVSNKALNPLVSNPLVSNNTLNPLVSNPLVSNSAVPDGTPVYDVIDTTWKVTGDGTVASAMSAAVNVANAQALEGSYVFQLLIHKTSSYGGAAGCDAKDVIQDQIISSIPNPLVSNPLVSNPLVSNPLVSNPLVSNSTFALSAPGDGGAAAARFSAQAIEAAISPDSTLQMDFKPDAVFVTLRAYQLVAVPPVVFNPSAQPPAVAVFSQSVNVVDGQEQGDSIEDAPVAFSGPDLAVPATVTVAPTSIPAGGLVQFPVGGWTVTNAGSADAVAPFSHGYYLSTDAAITNSDLLLGTETTAASIAPNGSQVFPVRTLTIPINTAPGNYFIGLLADRTNAVAEGNEGNNAAGVALTVTPAVSNAPLVVTVDADAGTGSLRQAIINANAAPGRDTITFNIPTGDTPSIILASPLPEVTTPVIIDGTTQPTSNRVDITGSDTQPDGLRISGGSSTIRGLIIRRFTGNGILITGAGGNLIEGNFIGIDQSGLEQAGNGANGVHIVDVPNNTIGGAAAASRNVISANAGEGVRIDGANATGNIVIGNYIGLNGPGTADFGNGASGVYIRRAPGNSVIGNVVSGNDTFAGVAICGNTISCGGGDFGDQTSTAPGNVVQGNFIGTAANGTTDLGNNGYGVSFDGTPDALLGGQDPSMRNVIAFNGVAGVVVFGPGASGNQIVRNSIHSNGGLGIDLGTTGGGDGVVTPNDLGDTDNGPNRLQNFPVVTSATNTGTATNVQWSLNTTANTQVVVDFFSSPSCDATGHGEGQTYLASVTQTTNPSGNLILSTDLPLLANGTILTAVATSAGGGTSEFSACQMVTPPGLVYWPVSEGGNGHVYEFVQQGALSWTAANTAAESRPNFNAMFSHLVSITGAAENAFVEALRNGGPLRAWIGLNDPDQTGTGSWTWTTGEPTGYFNWDQAVRLSRTTQPPSSGLRCSVAAPGTTTWFSIRAFQRMVTSWSTSSLLSGSDIPGAGRRA